MHGKRSLVRGSHIGKKVACGVWRITDIWRTCLVNSLHQRMWDGGRLSMAIHSSLIRVLRMSQPLLQWVPQLLALCMPYSYCTWHNVLQSRLDLKIREGRIDAFEIERVYIKSYLYSCTWWYLYGLLPSWYRTRYFDVSEEWNVETKE